MTPLNNIEGSQIPFKFDTLVIDGDMLAYTIAFRTQSKRVTVRYKDTQELIVDKPTFKSCESVLKKLGILDQDCWEQSTEILVHNNWEDIVRNSAEYILRNWKLKTFSKKVLIVFGGETNFRDRLDLLYQRI